MGWERGECGRLLRPGEPDAGELWRGDRVGRVAVEVESDEDVVVVEGVGELLPWAPRCWGRGRLRVDGTLLISRYVLPTLQLIITIIFELSD